MAAPMPLVWSEAQRLHDPAAEIWVGVRTPAVEVAARADAIRAELERAGHPVVAAARAARRRAAGGARPRAARLPRRRMERVGGVRAAAGPRPGPGRAVLLPPSRACSGRSRPRRRPRRGRAPALFAFDTMTLIGPGTWEAARGAADAALTAAELVLDGAPAAYACCRPPGHHVDAQRLRRLLLPQQRRVRRRAAARGARRARSRCSTSTRTTATARSRSSATAPTCSPAPSTSTRAPAGSRTSSASPARTARAAPTATSRSRPAAATSTWLAAVRRARALGARLRAARARGRARRRRRGRRPGEPAARDRRRLPRGRPRARERSACPTVVVQEGGYDLAAIGALVRAALEGIGEGLRGGRQWLSRCRTGSGATSPAAIPSQPRKDVAPPPHWRLEAIAATERPRSLTLGAGPAAAPCSSRTATPPTSGCSTSSEPRPCRRG